MKPRQQRMALIAGVLVGVVVAVGFGFSGVPGEPLLLLLPRRTSPRARRPQGRSFRLGGMVVNDSVQRESGSLTIDFVVTRFREQRASSLHGCASRSVQGRKGRRGSWPSRRKRPVRRARSSCQARRELHAAGSEGRPREDASGGQPVIPEIGQFALVLALCLALVQASFPLIGAWLGRQEWMALARPAAAGQFVFVAISFGILEYAFLTDDFSVEFVAQHSNSALPGFYKFTAAWGGHEGSMLFWITVLAVWTMAVAAFSRSQPEEFVSRVLGVLGIVSAGILAFALLTSNPFSRLFPSPGDGNDLNPLLQDPGMIIHPPMLYLGYVGMSVPFAFAVAALLTGRLDKNWAKWTRPWTVAAWVLLTCGITLGSWWSYYELGWGGWWFWDPVENSSFMPWLMATALLHSLAVSERRGIFKSWTVLLAIGAFSLSLLGTFLTRSGVLISVHAFAADPTRGLFILGILALYCGGALLLYAFRARRLEAEGGFRLVSRESFLMANNILLIAATASVLLGTLGPLIITALGLGTISVGVPWFNMMFLLSMLPLVFLLGVGMHTRLETDACRAAAAPPSLARRNRGGCGCRGAVARIRNHFCTNDHCRCRWRMGVCRARCWILCVSSCCAPARL